MNTPSTWVLRALPTDETARRWRNNIDRGLPCGGCGAMWIDHELNHRPGCCLLIVEDRS